MVNNMKKGALDQPFVYMFAIVVIGFILIFGIRSIVNLTDLEKDVENVKFFSDLNNLIDHTYNLDTNSYINRDIYVPVKMRTVCFIKQSDIPITLQDQIKQEMGLQLEKFKVYLIPSNVNDDMESKKLSDKAELVNSFCVLNNGKIKLRLKNKGSFVEITKGI